MAIPFNKSYFHEKCLKNIEQSYENNTLSGDGIFSKKCHDFFANNFNFRHNLLVTSCTHALEMMAILINVKDGDEIIIPSFTFVSTANAFHKFGAKIVCVDSMSDTPEIDVNEIEKNITAKTKAVCIVHYAGWACRMEEIISLCKKHNIILLEDAAQAINSFYKGQPLGSFGDMSAFSFHETKNIGCGEGGLLVINNEKYLKRAEIIREKGTNRSSFFKGEIEKYQWIDIGSSYLLSDINAGYLYTQLENIHEITYARKNIWELYFNELTKLEQFGYFKTCKKIENCDGNYHIFYLLFNDEKYLINTKNLLKSNGVLSTKHYIPLHLSSYYIKTFGETKKLPNAENFGEKILRLPIYFSIKKSEVEFIINIIKNYILELNSLNT
jgi:dTDP-4-amino-4,6-dideoxygalactose transaminase